MPQPKQKEPKAQIGVVETFIGMLRLDTDEHLLSAARKNRQYEFDFITNVHLSFLEELNKKSIGKKKLADLLNLALVIAQLSMLPESVRQSIFDQNTRENKMKEEGTTK